jgi:Phytanoyl-CoA dioxygenase (PhyH)
MNAGDIRSVTDAEVVHLQDHGWVKLDRLISPEATRLLLEQAKSYVGPDGADHVPRPGVDLFTPFWADYHDIVQEDESFAQLGLNPLMGANAQRLIRRDVGILIWSNLLAVKIGTKQGASASEPTVFHQDGCDLPLDRSSWVRFWIALDHLTVDMGPVRFIDRSHCLGSLPSLYLEDEGPPGAGYAPDTALFNAYPALREMSVSEPVEFQPGDATAHMPFTVHGAIANTTDRPRWSFIVTYFADDTRFTGMSICPPSNLAKIHTAGMAPGDRFDEELYPRVCAAG